jgi:uncharacterized protein with von Willebrand factor type A (vWA) domain
MPAAGHDELTPAGHLFEHLVLFGRFLRVLGLDVGPGQIITLGEALNYIDISNRREFFYAARAILVHRREDLPIFDLAFEYFWRPRRNPLLIPVEVNPDLIRRQLRMPPVELVSPGGAKPPEKKRDDLVVLEKQLTYSPVEVLRKKNFEAFTWEEVQQAKALMKALVWRISPRRTRRYRPGRDRRHPDFRRLLRKNLRHGGELVRLAFREPKFKQRPLVVLCDISGSMERYSRMLLHFVHTLTNGLDRVEAFVFGTRLTRITRQLRRKDIDEALAEVVRVVDDWSGGTRIGDAIKTFNYRWARRVLGQGAVVVIISDGWDRGDVSVLAREMARLQRSCYRLIWLNPLAGMRGFEPLARGLQAALPYVDDFLPAHNIESLEQLGKLLSTLDERRPARRQQVVLPAATAG